MNTCDIHLDRLLSYCNFLSGLVLTVSAAIFPLTVTAESDGWCTKTQAKAGETLYNTYCAQCHRTDLNGAMGPALKGKKFLSHYETGADLYNYTQKNMPLTDPSSVPEDDSSVHRRLLA
jgi:S-disulfanyl-L-cysteine oxidoreductase SoxD